MIKWFIRRLENWISRIDAKIADNDKKIEIARSAYQNGSIEDAYPGYSLSDIQESTSDLWVTRWRLTSIKHMLTK